MIKGGNAYPEIIRRRQDELQLDDSLLNINYVKEKVEISKQRWIEVVKKGIEIKNSELLDLYNKTIVGEDERTEKIRRRVLRKLHKAEYR